MNRSQEREQAFILLFEKEFSKELSVREILDTAYECGTEEMSEFAVTVAEGACEQMETLDAKIEENLRKWKLNRLPKTVLAILRLAVYEILHREDIPDSVSINEAVELAKKYAAPEDASFINGVLGTVARAK